MGIAIHNVSATTPGSHADASMDLAAAVRQDASGLLGTTVQYADLVSDSGFEGEDGRLPVNILYPPRGSDAPSFASPSVVGDPFCGRGIHVHWCGRRTTHVSLQFFFRYYVRVC